MQAPGYPSSDDSGEWEGREVANSERIKIALGVFPARKNALKRRRPSFSPLNVLVFHDTIVTESRFPLSNFETSHPFRRPSDDDCQPSAPHCLKMVPD
jgi:hypothetical protein